MKLPSLVLALSLLALPAHAQFNPSPNDPQAPVELQRYKGEMTDFEKVEFLCYSTTSGDYISTALCTAAEVEANKQAREYRLGFSKSGGNEDPKAFTLYVHITSAGTVPRGMSVRVEASRYYEQAIDQRAGYRDPANTGRSGKLVFFEETITGVGQGDNLEYQLRRRVKALIEKFFKARFD